MALRAAFSSRSTIATSSKKLRQSPLTVPRAAEPKQEAAPAPTEAPASAPADAKPTVVREYTAHGARIVESDATLRGPEDEKDFWEGEGMETFGKVMERFFIPGLIVLGIICGGIAARTYNDDADVFIAPPTGPGAEVQVIPAGALAPTVVVEAAPSTSS